MNYSFRSLSIGAGFAVFVCAGTLAFAQSLLDPTAGDQPEPMGSGSFLAPEQRGAVRERFQHRLSRMQMRHRAL